LNSCSSNSLGDVLGLVRVNVNVNVNVNVFVNVVVLTYIAEIEEFVFTPNLMSRFHREYTYKSRLPLRSCIA